MTQRPVKAAVAAALSACLVPPAIAAPAQIDRPPSATITHADLDLSGDAGRRELERRMRFAVNRVCPRPASLDLREHARHLACRRNARAQATRHSDLLIARYRAAPATLLASH